MTLDQRLAALEKQLITEPTVLLMPDGKTVTLTGPNDYLLTLFGIATLAARTRDSTTDKASGPDPALHRQLGAGRLPFRRTDPVLPARTCEEAGGGASVNLARRLRKLESLHRVDASGLVPQSDAWFAFYEREFDRMEAGEVVSTGIPLAMIDRIVAAADREDAEMALA
jgi:hypothetical protein